ncbi:hypothetical protein H6F74_04275 [Trichocoleus sp. FACHB-90]|uniref:type II toxin-antitoxin system HicB family antitoxin n=1 Tax=Cyanophyceae TaxID=3028117 RepID=UPI00168565B8|nr:hypothetical protein [Trichocoleus sp. FACHB-90]MBD1925503.1 hypothetical protein [Trichocoleus sp. FACHB-90]
MSDTKSIQTLIEEIEALSPEEQALLKQSFSPSISVQINTVGLEPSLLPDEQVSPLAPEPLKTGNAVFDNFDAAQSKFWGDEATYHVLLKNEPEGGVSATLLGWPECKAMGKTPQDAVSRLQDMVNALLAEAEIIPVKIRSTQSDNPWLKLAGKYKDDPLFDEFLENIAAYRRELDTEQEAYYRELDAQDEAK